MERKKLEKKSRDESTCFAEMNCFPGSVIKNFLYFLNEVSSLVEAVLANGSELLQIAKNILLFNLISWRNKVCSHCVCTCKYVCSSPVFSSLSVAVFRSPGPFHPEEREEEFRNLIFTGTMEIRSWIKNDHSGDASLMEIPRAFLGTRESIIDAHPGTEKQITWEGAFMGSAVVGGVYVCANASTYFLSEKKNKEVGGEKKDQ